MYLYIYKCLRIQGDASNSAVSLDWNSGGGGNKISGVTCTNCYIMMGADISFITNYVTRRQELDFEVIGMIDDSIFL